MKVNRPGDANQQQQVLRRLAPQKARAHSGQFGPSHSKPQASPLKPIMAEERARDSAPAETGTADSTQQPGNHDGIDARSSIRTWQQGIAKRITRTIDVPLWAAALLLVAAVVVTAGIVFVAVDRSSPSSQVAVDEPTATPSATGESADSTEVETAVEDAEPAPYVSEHFFDQAQWPEPDPPSASSREQYLLDQGVNPDGLQIRYAAEEVEQLQAELEAIQRNSAKLRSLARQQSGDLSAAYSSLEVSEEQRDGALEDLQSRIDDLEGQVGSVDELARELRGLLGLPEPDSGMGGPVSTTGTEADNPWMQLRADIVSVEQRAGSLVFDLDEINTEIQLRLTRVQQADLPPGGSVESDLRFYESMPVGWPIEGPLTSRFGLRGNPFGEGTDMHTGIDISAPSGSAVQATGAGTVRMASQSGGYGLLVVIDHGRGVSTWYGHNSRVLVSPGQRVEAGETIAEVGSTGMSTGPHVHYEIRINNVPQDPMHQMNLDR